MNQSELSLASTIVQAIASVATVGCALWAIIISRSVAREQRASSISTLRPWIVWEGQAELMDYLGPDRHLRFKQKFKAMGNQPAIDIRVDSYWHLVRVEDAKTQVRAEAITNPYRRGEGSLTALPPGESIYIFENKDRQRPLSQDDFDKVASRTHLIRIVMIIEYGGGIGAENYRTVVAVQSSPLTDGVVIPELQPVPDGFFLK